MSALQFSPKTSAKATSHVFFIAKSLENRVRQVECFSFVHCATKTVLCQEYFTGLLPPEPF